MKTTTQLGPRPSDPSMISFDRRCFETVGEQIEYVIVTPHSMRYPERFTDKTAAEKRSRVLGRPYEEHVTPIRRRISWT